SPEDLLKVVDTIQRAAPGEQETMVVRIHQLARLNKRQEAIAAMRSALDSTTVSLSERSLIRLASVSRVYQLGMEKGCFEQSEKKWGMSADLAYAEAIQKRLDGDSEGGKELLRKARAAATDPNSRSWMLGWARYLELMLLRDAGVKTSIEKARAI